MANVLYLYMYTAMPIMLRFALLDLPFLKIDHNNYQEFYNLQWTFDAQFQSNQPFLKALIMSNCVRYIAMYVYNSGCKN